MRNRDHPEYSDGDRLEPLPDSKHRFGRKKAPAACIAEAADGPTFHQYQSIVGELSGLPISATLKFLAHFAYDK